MKKIHNYESFLENETQKDDFWGKGFEDSSEIEGGMEEETEQSEMEDELEDEEEDCGECD
jgi:hypothetical protein